MKTVDLFRHTDNDGDALTPAGVAAAEQVAREELTPPYHAFVSTGAARATQMLEILRRAVNQDEVPILEEAGLRSFVEERWRDAAKAAGKGADLEATETPTSSTTSRPSSGRRWSGSSSGCPTVREHWSSGTPRPTRRRFSASPVRSSLPSARATACGSSRTRAATRSARSSVPPESRTDSTPHGGLHAGSRQIECRLPYY